MFAVSCAFIVFFFLPRRLNISKMQRHIICKKSLILYCFSTAIHLNHAVSFRQTGQTQPHIPKCRIMFSTPLMLMDAGGRSRYRRRSSGMMTLLKQFLHYFHYFEFVVGRWVFVSRHHSTYRKTWCNRRVNGVCFVISIRFGSTCLHLMCNCSFYQAVCRYNNLLMQLMIICVPVMLEAEIFKREKNCIHWREKNEKHISRSLFPHGRPRHSYRFI